MADNKDYIINLRVSRATYQKVKEKAKENGETISHLLRKIIDDSGEVMQDLSRDLFGKDRKKFGDIVAYHPAATAREIECAECGAKIAAGAEVTVGEERSGRKYFFCKKCRK